MAKSDTPTWTFIGFFVGLILTGIFVNQNLAILGGVLGGTLGFILGREV